MSTIKVIAKTAAHSLIECKPISIERHFTVSLARVIDTDNFKIIQPDLGVLAELGHLHFPSDLSCLALIEAQLDALPDGFEEIFHRNYAELDSGNAIDNMGDISLFLDLLCEATNTRLPSNFNKVTKRKSDQFDLHDLHVDSFNSVNGDMKRGDQRAFRYIFNLGATERDVALIPAPLECLQESDRHDSIKNPLQKLNDHLDGYLVAIPPIQLSSNCISYLKLDVFNVPHSSYGRRGDMAAMITSSC